MPSPAIDAFSIGNLAGAAIAMKPSLMAGRLLDDHGRPLVLDGWQAEYVDCEDPALLLAFRQSGKTTGTAIKALTTGLYWPERIVLIVSPTDRQSNIVLDRVKKFYGQLGGSLGAAQKQTADTVKFENGAEVVSLPGGNPDQIRGFSNVKLLIIDEAARVPDATFAAVVPMVSDEDGQIVCPTTPRGKAGWFFREWQDGEGWRRFKVLPEDSPRMTAGKIKNRRSKLTPSEFAMEYGLRFGGSEDQLFGPELIDAAMDENVQLLPIDWPRFRGR